MNLYLVTVETGGSRARYFDSIWVVEEHAIERRQQLHSELRRSGFPVAPSGDPRTDRWDVTVTVARCHDGEVKPKPGPKKKAEKE